MDIAVSTQGTFPPAGFNPEVSCDEAGKPYSALTLKYNGGDCSQTTGTQGDKQSCADQNGGPTAEGQNFIVAANTNFANGKGVPVGSTFTLKPASDKFSNDQVITVYADSTKAKVLQVVKFHISCSRNLFLSDKFGSVQIFGWVTQNDDAVSLKQPITIVTDVTNGDGADATMTSLTLDVDGDLGALIEEDTVVMPGETQSYPATSLVDTTAGDVWYASTVVYTAGNGVECQASANNYPILFNEV